MTGGPVGLFEENPLVFVAAVVLVVEGWLRVREPFLRLFRRRSET